MYRSGKHRVISSHGRIQIFDDEDPRQLCLQRGDIWLDRPGKLEVGIVYPTGLNPCPPCAWPDEREKSIREIIDIVGRDQQIIGVIGDYVADGRCISLPTCNVTAFEAILFVFHITLDANEGYVRHLSDPNHPSQKLAQYYYMEQENRYTRRGMTPRFVKECIQDLAHVYSGRIIPLMIIECSSDIKEPGDALFAFQREKGHYSNMEFDNPKIIAPDDHPFFVAKNFRTLLPNDSRDGSLNCDTIAKLQSELCRAATDPLRLWPTAHFRSLGPDIMDYVTRWSPEAERELRASEEQKARIVERCKTYLEGPDETLDKRYALMVGEVMAFLKEIDHSPKEAAQPPPSDNDAAVDCCPTKPSIDFRYWATWCWVHRDQWLQLGTFVWALCLGGLLVYVIALPPGIVKI